MQPLAWVSGGRADPADDDWGCSRAAIVLADHMPSDALAGLDEFSHIEVVTLLHLVSADEIRVGARRPRGNPAWPEVGILAQRGKGRPNRIGVSRCGVVGVGDRSIEVLGLDAIDGTPVLDVKPWMSEFGPHGGTRQPAWATELMREYYAGGPPG